MALAFTVGTFDDTSMYLTSGTGDLDDLVMAIADDVDDEAGWDPAFVSHNSVSYVCLQDHTSGASTEPGVGGSWTSYWWAAPDDEANNSWTTATAYDEAPITVSGDVYTVTDSHVDVADDARTLYVYGSTTLNIQEGKTLQWTLLDHEYPIFQVEAGCTVNFARDSTFIGDKDKVRYNYVYFYGEVNCNGESGHPVTFKWLRTLYIRSRSETAMSWSYVNIEEQAYAYGYGLTIIGSDGQYCLPAGTRHTFDHIHIDGTSNKSYGFYFQGSSHSSYEFTNISTNDCYLTFYFIYLDSIKIEGGTFEDSVVQGYLFDCGKGSPMANYTTSKTKIQGTQGNNQSYIHFKDITFDNNDSGVRLSGEIRSSVVMFEDCTFQNGTYGITAYHGSVILLKGTQTFTSVSVNKYWSTDSTYLHVWECNLTVKDQNGVVLEDACVDIHQSEGNEKWSFLTNSNGTILNQNDDPIVLVEKEETSLGVYVNWSDSISSGRYHSIRVSKPGYLPKEYKVEMTADRTIEINLTASPGPRLTPSSF